MDPSRLQFRKTLDSLIPNALGKDAVEYLQFLFYMYSAHRYHEKPANFREFRQFFNPYLFIKAKSDISLEDAEAFEEFGLKLFHSSPKKKKKNYVQVRWGNIFLRLLNKYGKQLSLKVQWRLSYEILLDTHFSGNTGPEGWRLRQLHFETLTSLIQSCGKFIPSGSASEIWLEFSADNLIEMDDFDGEENDAIERDMVKEPGQNSVVHSMKFIDEVLNGPNANCCENFRMDKKLFYKLCNILRAKGLLHHTNRIKIEEQLAIFLFTVGHNQRTRAVQERFQYSGETISRHFNNVLNAILALSLDYFLPSGPATPQEILDDPRFYPYFKDCIGAVDCTHIPVMVGIDEQGPFRNRSGFLSQNVLTACTFDLRFQYVLAGWEGSATDLRVLSAALTRHNKLSVPEGKYYLVDMEYANMPGFLAPYHGACCDLSEFKVDYRPQNAKELFNHRHSLLRNVIERTFKVWRARFPVLMSAPPYPLQTQVKLVVATCILHNYIRTEKSNDWLFSMYDQEGQQKIKTTKAEREPATQAESLRVDFPYEDKDLQMASELRDAVAAEMWNDRIHDL